MIRYLYETKPPQKQSKTKVTSLPSNLVGPARRDCTSINILRDILAGQRHATSPSIPKYLTKVLSQIAIWDDPSSRIILDRYTLHL